MLIEVRTRPKPPGVVVICPVQYTIRREPADANQCQSRAVSLLEPIVAASTRARFHIIRLRVVPGRATIPLRQNHRRTRPFAEPRIPIWGDPTVQMTQSTNELDIT